MGDPISAGTHLLAALGFGAALVPLWKRTEGDPWRRLTALTFGMSAILLFTASTAYHSAAYGTPLKALLRQYDHASIYVMIAGTFTPIVGNMYRGFFRGFILGVVWTLALSGIVLKLWFFGSTPEWVDVVLYLGMGWFGVIPCAPLLWKLPRAATAFIGTAAVAYTVGALCELEGWPTLAPGVFSFHEVSHLTVMLANACFYVFIFRYTLAVKAPVELSRDEPADDLATVAAGATV